MRRSGRIPKSIARKIDKHFESLKIVNEYKVLKEVGVYIIECTATEWSDKEERYEIWVIKKADYTNDHIENVLKAVDGKVVNNKDEANMTYINFRNTYISK